MLRIIRWTTLFYAIVLTFLLEMPSVPPEINPLGNSPVKVFIHMITFAILGFLVELGRTKKSMLFWLSMLALYSVGTEILQALLNSICHRCFDWYDIAQNVSGVLLGTFVGYCCRTFVKRPSKSLDKMEEKM